MTQAIEDLLEITRDQHVNLAERLNAAVAASRVSPLAQPGEPEPPAVQFLQWVINYKGDNKLQDTQFKASYRRAAAAALAYYQRRAAKAALQFAVTTTDEQQTAWRTLLNNLIRQHLVRHKRWPQQQNTLFQQHEPLPPFKHDPSLATAAILNHTQRQQRRRKAIDEPEQQTITSQTQRNDILQHLAQTIHNRLTACQLRAAP